MKAVQVVTLTGPSDVQVREVPEPTPTAHDVLVEVHSVGISFPDLLLSRGEYQFKPEPPFTLGVDFAGTVLDPGAAESSGFTVGQRVAGVNLHGGAAEQVANPVVFTFPLPDELSYDEGAALPMNYLTALFALEERGGLRDRETVLVRGAAGGVGTATLQVAKGLGARTIAVVSTDEKAQVARDAGADEVLRSDGPWKDEAKALGGADLIVDPVGGDRFTDSLRSLREEGRLVVVGFTGGSIPEVKVNRLLLKNTEVVGAGWGAYVMGKPELNREIGAALEALIESGHVRPLIGAKLPLEQGADAFRLIEDRKATGKVVVDIKA